MPAVSNASPLIWLARLGKLAILREIFGKVFITRTVYHEVVEKGLELSMPEAVEIRDAIGKWLLVVEPPEKHKKTLVELTKTLHQGEVDAVVLAMGKSLPILIDERPGTKAARVLGLDTIGTLQIILMAFEKELLSLKESKSLIDELVSTGFRLSARERERALDMLNVVAGEKK